MRGASVPRDLGHRPLPAVASAGALNPNPAIAHIMITSLERGDWYDQDRVGPRSSQVTLGWSLAWRAFRTERRCEALGRSPLLRRRIARHYTHAGLTEWYANGPLGLEQGFTVFKPAPTRLGSLVLTLRIGGSLVPKQVGSQILFRTDSGATNLRYGALEAVDATGRRLPAHLQLRDGTVQLRVATHDVRYPLRIDPFVQQGPKLTGGSENSGGRFGNSVALSADGNTALVGSESDGVAVFTRSGSKAWSLQTTLGGGGPEEFGYSVALSADGQRGVDGDPGIVLTQITQMLLRAVVHGLQAVRQCWTRRVPSCPQMTSRRPTRLGRNLKSIWLERRAFGQWRTGTDRRTQRQLRQRGRMGSSHSKGQPGSSRVPRSPRPKVKPGNGHISVGALPFPADGSYAVIGGGSELDTSPSGVAISEEAAPRLSEIPGAGCSLARALRGPNRPN